MCFHVGSACFQLDRAFAIRKCCRQWIYHAPKGPCRAIVIHIAKAITLFVDVRPLDFWISYDKNLFIFNSICELERERHICGKIQTKYRENDRIRHNCRKSNASRQTKYNSAKHKHTIYENNIYIYISVVFHSIYHRVCAMWHILLDKRNACGECDGQKHMYVISMCCCPTVARATLLRTSMGPRECMFDVWKDGRKDG